ncbi:WD40-like Beta Propeller Repeat [Tenacibaculum sp. MAR_2009_124]|uniref:OmpA family protein n=1 Tax=Tenacibaculum sp. MAR_2009_124 TaxID=1250059 RepID=UPI0008986B46|nr:OmpA family protein [Tenacibaculum sp. MAR_2009_124]SEC90593.1 WD40-like Beta Propeller Repeat [Tenacibaculum sp. MAR_2009_124]
MKLRGKSLLLLAALSFIKISAQSKRVADRYFEEFSYVQSAELYKAIVVEKGDSSKHVLSRLADSYYNNANTTEALDWYELLVKKYKSDLSDKYLFRYAQVLRSNGNYKKSDSIFLQLADKGGKNNRTTELENKNYLLDYSNNEDQRIGVRNLKLNTHYSEYGGFLLNGYAYFTSSAPKGDKKQKLYKWNNQPFLNIYKAKESIESLESNVKDTILELYDKKILPTPITTKYHEGKPVFTKDGKTMYFTRNNFDGKKVSRDRRRSVNLKIYKSRLINGEWSKVQELPFNSDDYSVGHPALSSDEKKLYFVSNMPGGFGGSDVYSVNIIDIDKYSTPVNLGKQVNTSDNEKFPFVGEDGTLYFSSNGHLGFGLLDIFQTKRQNDSTYSKAINLGEPFNSKKDDFAFYIDDIGKKGFFTSNRKGGKGDDDIYSFYIYQDVCEKEISGTVVDAKFGEIIVGANLKLINSEGNLINEVISDENGKYSFKKVPCDLAFTIAGSKFDHKSDKIAVNTKNKDIDVVKADLKLIPLIIGDQIVINPIYFDFNKSEIREDAQYELENIITVMKNHPQIVIKIEAHTDSRGNDLYNKKLSDRRAKATRDYIVSRGIDKKRIEKAIGYGEEKLLNNCTNARRNKCTEKEHQVNRRSYFFIVKGKEFIKAKQKAEIIKMKRRMSRKNSYLFFLRNNFKKGKNNNNDNKCIVGENCDDDESPNKM